MSTSESQPSVPLGAAPFLTWGMFWLLVAVAGAGVFFIDGINALLEAWQLPEYSHGPLIPVLSAFLMLKQLRDYPINPDVHRNRWPGVILVAFSLVMGALGILAGIGDIVAYALILWIGGILLISWGWDTGKHLWHGVVHLVYMLPLPGVIYYKTTTSLQFVSSELGVWFLKLLDVPVFLEGNIIDLGILKLHVAEACSGLRYMFPIMSFSYIFAMLYRGPVWQKLFLLLAAVPIAIVMNSIRIAVAGVVVQYYGVEWLDGFTHFFEGWVIFIACILILFGLAWLILFLNPGRPSLVEALDLDTSGMGAQLARLQFVQPSKELILASLMLLVVAGGLQTLPDRSGVTPDRERFHVFPRTLGEWHQRGPRGILSPSVQASLAADDYHDVIFVKDGDPRSVALFIAWYNDQSKNGVHSPEVCLPGGGWEIAWLERTDVTDVVGADVPFRINRAIIQKGETRMLVYYWFQQKERRIAWDFAAKFWLVVDGVRTGQTHGALIRLTTIMGPNETSETAAARLNEVLLEMEPSLPRFIPRD